MEHLVIVLNGILVQVAIAFLSIVSGNTLGIGVVGAVALRTEKSLTVITPCQGVARSAQVNQTVAALSVVGF